MLVTGAGGFIGSHLAERLVELGARVRALVRYNSRNDWGLLELLPAAVKNEIEVVPGDLTDPHSTTRMVQGCPIIFHLAALIAIPYSYIAPALYIMPASWRLACRQPGDRLQGRTDGLVGMVSYLQAFSGYFSAS